jgi:hypothetical protein
VNTSELVSSKVIEFVEILIHLCVMERKFASIPSVVAVYLFVYLLESAELFI